MSPDALAPGSVRIDHLWKRFRIDDPPQRYGVAEMRRLKKLLAGDHLSGWRWVLRDISLQVEPGETLGFVGINGSGKSTLLKIAAGLVHPYAGSATSSGRIGSLMDVQAGIQSDLTGRENVLLYGRMLGYSMRQMREIADEIIEFAGIEDAVDRLVKHYSSGMSVRLGFSIASHLEPDILIVDEALAVGDADFRLKCMKRMREVVAGGTTLLYVSHGLESIQAMCKKAVWLDGGVIRSAGTSADVVAAYREATMGAIIDSDEEVVLEAEAERGVGYSKTGGSKNISLFVASRTERAAEITIGLSLGEVDPFVTMNHHVQLKPGPNHFTLTMHDLPLAQSRLRLWATVNDSAGIALCSWQPLLWFRVMGDELPPPPRGVSRMAPIWIRSSLAPVS